MNAAAVRRKGGSLARLEGSRTLCAVDRALASPEGLDVESLARELECDPRTLRNYVCDLTIGGIGRPAVPQIEIDRDTGAYRYAGAKPRRLFTEAGDDLLG